mgnify:FL=1|jgi:F0F1-type ATP synthase delta subunit
MLKKFIFIFKFYNHKSKGGKLLVNFYFCMLKNLKISFYFQIAKQLSDIFEPRKNILKTIRHGYAQTVIMKTVDL